MPLPSHHFPVGSWFLPWPVRWPPRSGVCGCRLRSLERWAAGCLRGWAGRRGLHGNGPAGVRASGGRCGLPGPPPRPRPPGPAGVFEERGPGQQPAWQRAPGEPAAGRRRAREASSGTCCPLHPYLHRMVQRLLGRHCAQSPRPLLFFFFLANSWRRSS